MLITVLQFIISTPGGIRARATAVKDQRLPACVTGDTIDLPLQLICIMLLILESSFVCCLLSVLFCFKKKDILCLIYWELFL